MACCCFIHCLRYCQPHWFRERMRTQLRVQVPLEHCQSLTSRSFETSLYLFCSSRRSTWCRTDFLHLLFLYRSLPELRVRAKHTSVYCTEWWAWIENSQKSETPMIFPNILHVTDLSFLPFFGTLSPILITATHFSPSLFTAPMSYYHAL